MLCGYRPCRNFLNNSQSEALYHSGIIPATKVLKTSNLKHIYCAQNDYIFAHISNLQTSRN